MDCKGNKYGAPDLEPSLLSKILWHTYHKRGFEPGFELFRLRNVETQLYTLTKHFIGDLVFTENGIALVQRVRYVNLWGALKDPAMSLLLLFGPAAFIFACVTGAVVFFLTDNEEAFGIGGIIGAIVSIPLSIWVISRINKTSLKNASVILKKSIASDPVLSPRNLIVYINRENLKQIIYEPGEKSLRLVHKDEYIVASISYNDWEKNAEQVYAYIEGNRST